MFKINENYQRIKEGYLFSNIAKKVAVYCEKHPEREVIKLGIGDVTLPLCPAVTDALAEASREMGKKESFHGYGPEQGYDFVKNAVKEYYAKNGVTLEEGEIFISDGAKSDLGNILDILSQDNIVAVPDPVYPVYVDTNVMDGRKIVYLKADETNGFLPLPDETLKCDIIYLCSPNNPTGAAYDREGLKKWVDFAAKNGALILFDAAYESFISNPDLPRSIFEIEGAKSCAIEFCSLSKTAGFTGTRCGYTIVPFDLVSGGMSLNKMWLRRQTTKFNGVSFIVQKGAAAVFSEEGQRQVKEAVAYYKENAKLICNAMKELDIWYTGGENSPYVWLKCPGGMKSWDFFDYLLENANVVGTPGEGFGENGEGFFRLTAFNSRENTIKAVERLKKAVASLK